MMTRAFCKIKAFLVTFFSGLLSCYPAMSQTGVNSPYSRYGIGMLSDQSTGIAKSMGGIGAGFVMSNTLNFKNPASFAMIDTLTFVADLGFALQNGNFSENGVSINARNASINHMAMQFRVLPKLGMGVGFLPFSNIGYEYSGTELVRRDEDGEIKAYNTYTGTGGLRQVVVGLGWRTSKRLYMGLNASYVMGDISHKISSTYSSSLVQSRTKTYSADMSAFKLDLGVQGILPIAGNDLVLGVTYSPAMKAKSNATVVDAHSRSDTTTIADAFSFPDLMSAGFTYKWKNMMIGADVSYQYWSKAAFFGQKTGLDRLSAAAGFMIRPDEDSKNIFMRSSYQIGANMSQPYFNTGNGKGPMQFGVSAGISIPFTTSYNSMSHLHVSGEFVRVQPSEKWMVTENYFRLNLAVTFMERWFMKIMVD